MWLYLKVTIKFDISFQSKLKCTEITIEAHQTHRHMLLKKVTFLEILEKNNQSKLDKKKTFLTRGLGKMHTPSWLLHITRNSWPA